MHTKFPANRDVILALLVVMVLFVLAGVLLVGLQYVCSRRLPDLLVIKGRKEGRRS